MKLFDSELIRLAYLREDARIRELEIRFAGDQEFILKAIIKGWSPEQASHEKAEENLRPTDSWREAS